MMELRTRFPSLEVALEYKEGRPQWRIMGSPDDEHQAGVFIREFLARDEEGHTDDPFSVPRVDVDEYDRQTRERGSMLEIYGDDEA